MRSFLGSFLPNTLLTFLWKAATSTFFLPWSSGTWLPWRRHNFWGNRLCGSPKKHLGWVCKIVQECSQEWLTILSAYGRFLKYFQIYSRPMCFFNAWFNPHSVGGSEVFHDCWILLVRVTTISTTPLVGFSRVILPTVISHWNPERGLPSHIPLTSRSRLGRFLPTFSLARGFWPWHGRYIGKKTCLNSTFCSLKSLGETMSTLIFFDEDNHCWFFSLCLSHNPFIRKRTSRINSIGSLVTCCQQDLGDA